LPLAYFRPLQTVQFGAESVSSLRWNGCPVCRGIGVQFGVEWVSRLARKTHLDMQPYIFLGVVLPERAQISIHFSLTFISLNGGTEGVAHVSIVLNQISVQVFSDHEWDIFDLRNIVQSIIQDHLAMTGFLLGHAYDFEITRVLHCDRNIDFVFGIDIGCISERGRGIDIQSELAKLFEKTKGKHGIFLNRCFADLSFSMKYANDTGFYCYRAIEALRHHCAAEHDVADATKLKQWEKFREVSGVTEEAIRQIKVAADPLRHGEAVSCSGEERAKLFAVTWEIVESYLKCVASAR
jgi:hypothetical protein